MPHWSSWTSSGPPAPAARVRAPEGGNLRGEQLRPLAARLKERLDFARGMRAVVRDEEAGTIWRKIYPEPSGGRPGLFGAVTSRAQAQVMRLALLDGSPVARLLPASL